MRSDTDPNLNGVLIASKLPLEKRCHYAPNLEQPYRLLQSTIKGVIVVGVYMPLDPAKTTYWDAIIAKAPEIATVPTLMIGDFNTGRHYMDEKGATFTSAKYMDHMEDVGFTDVWRKAHSEEREFSWYSNRGNGFRLDHAFASTSLVSQITSVYYSHQAREQGFSDHSIMVVEC